jgi:DNA-binding LacI/PurR family transcriptional regulator
MTDLLIARGHRRIAIVYEHPESTSIQLRARGVRESLDRHGLALPGELQIDIRVRDVARRGRRLVRTLRAAGVTAVFCFECELAAAMHAALQAAGVDVPGEISLCSFDDHCFTGERAGFVTAVVQPLEQIGQTAVELVLRGLDGNRVRRSRIVLRPRIVERRSVASL